MKLNLVTIAITLGAAASIFAVTAYNGAKMEVVNSQEIAMLDETIMNVPEVSVVHVSVADYQAQVLGYGEAKARYELALTAEVSGQVERLSPDFKTGYQVSKNTLLASVNDVEYQNAFATASTSVADANLALLEEQREGQQVLLEWQTSGMRGQPDSDLVLRKPQLAAAKAKLAGAKTELAKAQYNLDKTKLTAPFSALIVTREVQPGSYIQPGSQIATLYSTDRIEIEVPLSAEQWANLPLISSLDKTKWPVVLKDAQGQSQWQGYVDRVEMHLESSNRQRSAIVAVDKPLEQATPLFPGTFVTASITGKSLESLWQVPASAISQSGDVWFVNEAGVLDKFNAQKRFSKNDATYIVPFDADITAQIVARPLSSYMTGMKVTAKNRSDRSTNTQVLASAVVISRGAF